MRTLFEVRPRVGGGVDVHASDARMAAWVLGAAKLKGAKVRLPVEGPDGLTYGANLHGLRGGDVGFSLWLADFLLSHGAVPLGNGEFYLDES